MFLPIGDFPNPPGYRPLVTWGLIAANVAVFLLVALPVPPETYQAVVENFGYVSARPSVLTLFTSMFLHGGFMHLAGNMLFLWIFGDNVEHRLGRVTYLIVYLATGIAGTLFFSLLSGTSTTPLVGASGAISGVLGAYFVFFPRNQVRLMLLFIIFLRVFTVPARWVLGFYVVVQNLIPLLFNAQSNVAYGAHFGGFLAGAAVAWIAERGLATRQFKRKPKSKKTQTVRVKPRVRVVQSEDAVIDAVVRNDRETAFAEYRRLGPIKLASDHPEAALKIAEWLADADEYIAAADLLRKILGHSGREVDQARVYLVLGLVRLAQGQRVSAYQHLMSVFDFDPDGETSERAHQALERAR